MTSRLQQQLAAFRAQEAKASKTKDDLGKERERKRAERKANVVQAKPKPATVAPAPVRRAARKVPLAKLVKDVLDCVQESDQALSAEEIKVKCGVEIETDPELLSTLQNHERLQVINSLWSYKARHAARNKNDLMKLLLKYPEGIYTVELKDAYKGVADDLKNLKEEKKIFVIQSTEDVNQEVIFPCDPKLPVTSDDGVRQLWDEVWVNLNPEHIDAELKKAGIKQSARKEKRVLDLKQRKDRKKRSSRQRVFTNAHMVAEPKAE